MGWDCATTLTPRRRDAENSRKSDSINERQEGRRCGRRNRFCPGCFSFLSEFSASPRQKAVTDASSYLSRAAGCWHQKFTRRGHRPRLAMSMGWTPDPRGTHKWLFLKPIACGPETALSLEERLGGSGSHDHTQSRVRPPGQIAV